MLFFIDESGQDRLEAPYEVLAGVAIREHDLWNLLQAIRSAETDIFGVRLSEYGVEFKGKSSSKEKFSVWLTKSHLLLQIDEERCAVNFYKREKLNHQVEKLSRATWKNLQPMVKPYWNL